MDEWQPAGPARTHRDRSPAALRGGAWRGAGGARCRGWGARRERERAWRLLRRYDPRHGAAGVRGARHDYERRSAATALGAAARAADGCAGREGRAAE